MDEFLKIRRWKRYLFRAPSSLISSTLILITCLIYPADLKTKIIIFILTILSSTFLSLLFTLTKNYFPARRIFLLNFLSITITIPPAYLYSLLNIFVLHALSLSIFLKYLVISTFINGKLLKLSSADLPTFALILVPHETILSYIIMILVLITVSELTMKIITSEFKKTFKNSPLDFVRNFVNFIDRGEKLDRYEIENFFVKIGEERSITCRFLFLERDNENLLLLFPDIHPGPFEEIGGSNLPSKIQNNIKYTSMVFHTGTTHDDNASSSQEILELSKLIENTIERRNLKELKGFGFERSKEYISIRFGNILWISFIPAEKNFDDIYLYVSEKIRENAIEKGFNDCIVVDAHNNHTPNSLPLKYPPQIKYSINILCENIKTGYAELNINAKSVGPRGIQTLSIKCNNNIYSLVLIDGNNMISGLRNSILNSLKKLVTDAEVFTTDNHFTNITTIDEYPVGKDNYQNIIKLCEECVRKSLENMKETRIYYGLINHKMHVAGEGHMKKMGRVVMRAAKKALITTIIGLSISLLLPILTSSPL